MYYWHVDQRRDKFVLQTQINTLTLSGGAVGDLIKWEALWGGGQVCWENWLAGGVVGS